MSNVRNDKFKCPMCLLNDSCFVTSCGCHLCKECYNEMKSFINTDKARCMNCNKFINYGITINIYNKKEVTGLIEKHKEHYKLIFDMINVFLNYIIVTLVL